MLTLKGYLHTYYTIPKANVKRNFCNWKSINFRRSRQTCSQISKGFKFKMPFKEPSFKILCSHNLGKFHFAQNQSILWKKLKSNFCHSIKHSLLANIIITIIIFVSLEMTPKHFDPFFGINGDEVQTLRDRLLWIV